MRSDFRRDPRRVAMLRALDAIVQTSSVERFRDAAEDEFARVLRLLIADAPEEAEDGTTSAAIQTPPVASVGVQPAAPFQCPPASDAPLPNGYGWRELRAELRARGYEVKQYDGTVYVDGVPSADPRLYPPEAV